MFLSVVIPSHDKVERLVLALHSYLNQSIGVDRFEVIVVADGCGDETVAVARSFEDRLRNPGRGYGTARPVGDAQPRCQTGAGPAAGVHGRRRPNLPGLPGTVYHGGRGPRRGRRAGAGLYLVRGPLFPRPRVRNPLPGVQWIYPGNITASPDACDSPHDRGRLALGGQTVLPVEPLRAAGSEEPGSGQERTPPPWVGMSGSGVVLDRCRFLYTGGYDEAFGLWWGAESLELGFRLWQDGAIFRNLVGVFSAHLDHPRDGVLETFARSFDYFAAKHPDPVVRQVERLIRGDDNFGNFSPRTGEP